MHIITTEKINQLVAAGSTTPAVTIYAPMHASTSPAHIAENQTRLKTLITQACSQLADSYGKDQPLIQELEAWHQSHHNDLNFWDSQTAGFLLCARPGDSQWFNLPVEADSYVAIDKDFHLAPVLAMLAHDHDYYVLTVDQHHPKLFKGNSYSLAIAPIELPASLETALGIDEAGQKGESQGSASGSSQNTSSFNGRGGGHDPKEEDRLKFFRIIDRTICEQDKLGLPMILAGTTSETAEYRATSKYRHLLQSTINGSHTDTDLDNLRQQALMIVKKELVQPAHQAFIQEYQQLEGAHPQRVADDVESIAVATKEGRVATLLATMTSQTTDSIKDSSQPVQKISLPAGEKGKLLNNVALKVWQMRGTIISLSPQDMPGSAAMVAQLRY